MIPMQLAVYRVPEDKTEAARAFLEGQPEYFAGFVRQVRLKGEMWPHLLDTRFDAEFETLVGESLADMKAGAA